MSEKNLDFDTVIDRRGTNCLKYDFAVERGKPADILPLWVADMDFKTSSYIQSALADVVNHGIYGYSEVKDDYFNALASWMHNRHNYDIERKWLVKTPGIVFALAMAVKAYTAKGDSVLIQSPVYYPFKEVIEDNGRVAVSNDLVRLDEGRYVMDIDDFEKKIIENDIHLFFLCSPHNPVGRVWTPDELEAVGDICVKHNVIIVSDEIHSDFVFKGEHHVLASLKKEYADITITCTAPSKTFNLAGLQISNLFIPNDSLRRRFKRELDAAGYSQLGIMGLVACEAAYAHGGEWYEAVLKYIKANIDYTREYVESNIPGVHMSEHEGTYLVWLDFRELGLSPAEQEHLIVDEAGLWLDSGSIFGKTGIGFERINVACPRATLKEALERIERAVKNLTQK